MNVILNNTCTMVLSFIALFLIIFSYVVQNKKIAAIVQIASFLCVLAVITYALLLGAELLEILILILIFALISSFSFIPKREKPENMRNEKQEKHTEEENSGEDGNEL